MGNICDCGSSEADVLVQALKQDYEKKAKLMLDITYGIVAKDRSQLQKAALKTSKNLDDLKSSLNLIENSQKSSFSSSVLSESFQTQVQGPFCTYEKNMELAQGSINRHISLYNRDQALLKENKDKIEILKKIVKAENAKADLIKSLKSKTLKIKKYLAIIGRRNMQIKQNTIHKLKAFKGIDDCNSKIQKIRQKNFVLNKAFSVGSIVDNEAFGRKKIMSHCYSESRYGLKEEKQVLKNDFRGISIASTNGGQTDLEVITIDINNWGNISEICTAAHMLVIESSELKEKIKRL